MRLLKCEVENFGSYDKLEFDFSNLGLSLLYGPTGAGKSTLMDAAFWCLFGSTMRGSVDDVRSWSRPDAVTKGSLDVKLNNGTQITIIRVRGRASQNDLYWINPDGKYGRGKDIKETQTFLNGILNVSSELYLNAVYYSEFSPVGSFFIDNSKARRQLLEKIADLSFPTKLAERATSAKKQYKDECTAITQEKSSLEGQHKSHNSHVKKLTDNFLDWVRVHTNNIDRLRHLSDNFESSRKVKLAALEEESIEWDRSNKKAVSEAKKGYQEFVKAIKRDQKLQREYQNLLTHPTEVCSECNQLKDSHTVRKSQIIEELKDASMHKALCKSSERDLEKLEKQVNPHISSINSISEATNVYKSTLEQTKQETNPFADTLVDAEVELESLKKKLKDKDVELEAAKLNHAASTQLYDLSIKMRGILVSNSVKMIESKSNEYLTKYFDSEFKLEMIAEEDNVNLSIYKNGYLCNFKQLSKGQRGILRLCFSVALMQIAANNAGIHFDNLFFDESLDGLDVDFKIKAYGLFSELATKHDSVLVIDHATEFKTLFQNQFEVTLVGDSSRITSNESENH